MQIKTNRHLFVIIFFFLSVITFIILLLLSTFLCNYVNDMEKARLNNNIVALSASYKTVVNSYIEDKTNIIEALSAIVSIVSNGNLFDAGEVSGKLNNTDEIVTNSNIMPLSEINGILSNLVADKDVDFWAVYNVNGIAFIENQESGDTADNKIIDISSENEFLRAMQGKTVMMGLRSSEISNKKVIMWLSPIFYENNIIGVMQIGLFQETLQEALGYLNVNNGLHYLVLTITEEDEKVLLATDLQISKVDGSINLGEDNDNYSIIDLHDVKYYMHCLKLDDEMFYSKWYLLTLVEKVNIEKYVTNYKNIGRLIISLLCITIVIFIGVLSIFIYFYNRENKEDIQKAKATLEFQKKYTFEYDFKDKKVYFSKLTAKMLSLKKNEYTMKELVEFGFISEENFNEIYALNRNYEKLKNFEYSFFSPLTNRYYKVKAKMLFIHTLNRNCFLGIVEDITNEYFEKEELLKNAEIDGLSGLYNRLTFKNFILNQPKDSDSLDAFMLFDIDKFKEINDTYGHLEGDKVIKAVGEVFEELGKKYSQVVIASRFGGDEFAIYLKDLKNENQIEQVLDFIFSELDKKKNNLSGIFYLSVGIAFGHGGEYLEYYQQADKALYFSKKYDGNRYTIYADEQSMIANKWNSKN